MALVCSCGFTRSRTRRWRPPTLVRIAALLLTAVSGRAVANAARRAGVRRQAPTSARSDLGRQLPRVIAHSAASRPQPNPPHRRREAAGQTWGQTPCRPAPGHGRTAEHPPCLAGSLPSISRKNGRRKVCYAVTRPSITDANISTAS